jgi:glutaminyl-tRNA synthetase
VFNKIVGLKESSSKKKKAPQPAVKSQEKKVQIDGEVAPMSKKEQEAFNIYTTELTLNNEVANTLVRDKKLSQFYVNALEGQFENRVSIANLVVNEVARQLKKVEINELKFTPKQIAELAKMMDDETISSKIAKQVFEEMVKSGESPKKIVEAKGLVQISDPTILLPIIEEVIAKNPENIDNFLGGNTKLLGFFVGQVLQATKGKGNPKVVNELVKEQIVDACPHCLQPIFSFSDMVFIIDNGRCSTCQNNWDKNYSD